VIVFGAGGCPAPARPQVKDLPGWSAQVTAASTCTVRATSVDPGGAVRATFGHRGALTIAGTAIPDAGGDTATIVGFDHERVAWSRSLLGSPGPIDAAGANVVTAMGATGSIQLDGKPLAIRGTPGAVAIALDAKTGVTKWAVGLGATSWAQVSSIAGLDGGDVAIGGSFEGTLRVGGSVVTSGGAADGFVARLGPAGEVRFLVRVGGEGADGVAGVAASGDKVAVAGTFTGNIDFKGVPLDAQKPELPFADGFVAMLDASGTVAWARAFGSPQPEQVAGVAVTRGGTIAVAGTVRDVAYVGASAASITAGGVEDWSGHGIADALVAMWGPSGEPVGSALLGGPDYDGARAIAARDDEILVGGWFSGAADFASKTFHAGGGDDAFVAVFDDHAHELRASILAGDGREDISALAASPAGYAAGLAFTTSATFDNTTLASPADPAGGCAVVFRPR